MSEVLLQEYLEPFRQRYGFSQYHATLAVRGEREPGFREAFIAHLRSFDDEGARRALKCIEAI